MDYGTQKTKYHPEVENRVHCQTFRDSPSENFGSMNAQIVGIPEGSMVATAADLALGRDILPFPLSAGLRRHPSPLPPKAQTSSSVFQTMLALHSVALRRTGSSPTWSSATSTTSVWQISQRRSSARTVSCLTPLIPTQSSATTPSMLTVETGNMFVSTFITTITPFMIIPLKTFPNHTFACRGA